MPRGTNSTMTRRNFITIADTIRHLDLAYAGLSTPDAISELRRRIAEQFANKLADCNNGFKRELFLTACTLADEETK